MEAAACYSMTDANGRRDVCELKFVRARFGSV